MMRGLLSALLVLFGISSVSGGEISQIALTSASNDDTIDQTFVLRHFFYHDLIAPSEQPPTFVNFIKPPDEYDLRNTERSWNKTIKVRTVERDAAAAAAALPSEDEDFDDSGHVGMGATAASTRLVPATSEKETVINLATMTYDAYYINASDSDWLNVSQGFNDSLNFGFDGKGLRGQIFSTPDNATVIVAFKGSSTSPLDVTHDRDRLNDNLLFSCCCATQQPFSWLYGSVCDCRQDVYSCNATCLTSELERPHRYYSVAKSVMLNVSRDLFPSATTVWAVGHSLGGSLASLMGLTFDIPAVTFEAPPDRLAAQRLGLYPLDPKARRPLGPPAYHFGNTADPIFMGACNGWTASCSLAGFAFDSACFTGKRCVYDTVMDKGWSVNVLNHRIKTVIDKVLKKYDTVPECVDEDEECVDCFNWNFH